MVMEFGNILTAYFDFIWMSFLLLGPMLMLGLLLSGLIHVFISREAILRWLQDDSLRSVSVSSAVGVPVPLCSCSVVPVVAEMRRKGASRSSCMAFLITAPETGADSILVTNAFFGFIAAVVRPVISFITAVVAGIFCIGLIRDDSGEAKAGEEDHGHVHHDHDHGHDHGHDHDHDHDHSVHDPLLSNKDDCYVSPSAMKILMTKWIKGLTTVASTWRFGSWIKPEFYREIIGEQPAKSAKRTELDMVEEEYPGLDFKKIVKHIFNYGFVEIADDILFALLVGIALGGVLFLVIPADLMSNEYARWLSYPVMIIVGVPLYICASASTPIAAALVARGVSPGAALIFLMTGPATNTSTIAIIMSQFGARFAAVYVTSVIAVTAVIGIAIDFMLLATGFTISVNLLPSESPALQILQWGGALGLIALIIWRYRAGAMRSGYEDLMLNIRPLSRPWRNAWKRLTRDRSFRGTITPATPMGMMLWGLLLVLFLGSGFTAVPPGHVGYGRLFGEVYWRDLQPGLHYLAPRPLVQVDKWPVREVKSIMSETPYEYVSGDLNMLTLTLDVQYRVNDPYTYHYRTVDPEEIIEDAVREHVRTFVNARDLDRLLTAYRAELEDELTNLFVTDARMHGDKSVLSTVDLVKVSLLNVTPAAEALSSFREISSAQEDRERIIVNAQRFMVSLVPRAHGNAEYEKEQADGEAFRKVATSAAEADAIMVISSAMQTAPEVLRNMLWREKLESALAGNPKIIVPNRQSFNKVAIWKKRPAEAAAPSAKTGGKGK